MELVYAWFGAGLVLAPFSYAMTLHYWQHKYPTVADGTYDDDVRMGVVFGVLTLLVPLLALVVAYMSLGRHFGLKWR